MFKHIFHAKHIFDQCIEIKIIFLHIFKIQYKKKIISFYKFCINFPYLKKTLKNLEVFNPEEFDPKKPISNLTKKRQLLLLTIYLNLKV